MPFPSTSSSSYSLISIPCLLTTNPRQIATAQTIAGTGANRIAAAFLHRHLRLPESNNSLPSVYIGEPAWGNYRPLFAAAGFTVESYQHCLPKATSLSLDNILAAAEHAPRGSIFVLQGCCHNPTGLDYTPAQWRAIVEKMLVKGHFAFFDIAYQGFGSSSATALDDDAFAVRYFAENGIPMLAAQSFSKNFGLYGERLGAVHVLCETAGIAENVLDQIRVQLRWEVSSTPAYPARLVDIILSDPDLSREWRVELSKAAGRIQSLREGLHQSLIANDGSPEQWEHVLAEKGLFCLTGLSKAQTDVIAREHSVYMAPNGRINVAGLSKGNLEYTAKAICEVLGMGQVATPPGED